jgi:hypothetical protein
MFACPLCADFVAKVRDQEQGKRGIFLESSVAIRSIEGGEDAVVLATATVMQHTRHRLVVVEQPVWRAAVGSVR